MTDEAAEIARGLTAAQRFTISGVLRFAHGEWIVCQGTMGSIKALQRKGILHNSSLTPLGLRVRAILQSEATRMTDELTREEWIRRFVQHMLDRAAPRDHFDDGELILDYAEQTAPTYWETHWQRGMGPEECADADISYWGEE